MKLLDQDSKIEMTEDCDNVTIQYYTANPHRPLDAHQTRLVKRDVYQPLFLCTETWEWNGLKYVKTNLDEVMLSWSDTLETRKILKYINLERDKAYGIPDTDKYKVPVYYLSEGGRWTKPIIYEE